MNRKVNRIIWFAGFCVLCVGVFLLMKVLYDVSGYSGDDYLYHFFYQGEWPHHLRGIHNPWELLLSLQNHTRIYNGRFVAHAGVMTAMQFPKAVFNVASAIVFVLVGILMNLHVFGKKRIRVGFLALTFALMWVGLPDYGTTILWLSGAFNYLWVALIYLSFLLPYRFNYHAKHPRLMVAGMTVLGFFAGATNENAAPVTVFIALAFTLFDWQESQLGWKWAGGIAAGFGYYIVLVSGVNQIAVRGKQFQIGKLIAETERYSGWLLLLVAGVLVYLGWQHHTFGHQLLWRRDREYLAGCLYALGACLGIVALIVSPQILSRVFFGPNVYLIIALLLLAQDHARLRAGTWISRLLPGLLALCLGVYAIPGYQAAVQSNYRSYQTWANGDAICRYDAKHGIKHAAVPGMAPVYTDRNQYWQSTYVANGNPKKRWFNVWMAAYYHLDTVTVDNSLPLKRYAAVEHTWGWHLYQALFRAYSRGQHLIKGQRVSAATQMRTATLRYIDTAGKQVGTEPISGNIGTTFDISHASVAGYITKAGNPKHYTFTAAAGQSLVIHVARQAKALLVFQAGKQTVATEPISGAAGQTVDIHRAGTAGYRTLGSAPTTYRLTAAANQRVVIPVQAQKQGITISYVDDGHRVYRVYEEVATGHNIPIRAPFGYRLLKPTTRVMPASGLATLSIPVTRVHGWLRLKTSVPFWVVIVLLLLALWDHVAAYRVYRGLVRTKGV